MWSQNFIMEHWYDINRLKQGDKAAFHEFHQEHIKLFIQFDMRFIDDGEVVRDIVQEAFIATWEKINTFNEESHIKAFIYTVIRNKSINYLRSVKAEKRYQEELLKLENNDKFVTIAIEEEMYSILCKKIDTLSPMQSSILWLHVDGYSNDEIAEKLNISVNTVLTHKQRYKLILKDYLKNFSTYIVFYL